MKLHFVFRLYKGNNVQFASFMNFMHPLPLKYFEMFGAYHTADSCYCSTKNYLEISHWFQKNFDNKGVLRIYEIISEVVEKLNQE